MVSHPHAPSTSPSLAAAVMRLTADYAGEALTELATVNTRARAPSRALKRFPAASVSIKTEAADEDEEGDGDRKGMGLPGAGVGEVARIAARARRITRIVEAVEAVTRRGSATGAGTRDGSAPDVAASSLSARYGSPVAGAAIVALGNSLAALTGAEPPVLRCDGSEREARTGAATGSLVRWSRPIALPEAALALYALNTRTVFRRRPTEATSSCPVPGEEGRPPRKRTRPPGVLSELAEEQRAVRFAAYTSRRALLPRLDTLDAALRARPDEAGPLCSTWHVSPALRELAALNVMAERRMLARAWAVATRAGLLARLPALAASVRTAKGELTALLSAHTSGPERAAAAVAPYWVFTHCDEGVLRVSVQHGLYVDLTYELVERQWTLLRLHWNVWGPPLTSAPDDEAVLAELSRAPHPTPAEALVDPAERVEASLQYHRLLPNQEAAMHRYVQAQLVDGGLEAGLLAANRLLGTFTMDVVARQARRLQSHLAAPPLHKALVVEVRPGTHVSLMASPPLTTSAVAGRAPGSRLMVKYHVAAGTVLREVAWTGGAEAAAGGGREARSAERVLVRDAEADRVVLDIEEHLWETLLGSRP